MKIFVYKASKQYSRLLYIEQILDDFEYCSINCIDNIIEITKHYLDVPKKAQKTGKVMTINSESELGTYELIEQNDNKLIFELN